VAALLLAADGGAEAVGSAGVVADRAASNGVAALRNFAKESARNGSAPGKRTVCGFMWTPFIKYS
jgi:hypothetical protein